MTDSSRILEVRVVPRSRQDSVEEKQGLLIVRTRAVPEDGKANEAVRRILANHLGLGANCVELLSGGRSRRKLFRIRS